MWRNPMLGDKCLLGPLGLMIAQRHPGSFIRGHATVQRVASLGADRLAF